MLKQRLLVMNKQKLLQNEINGEWKTQKVSKEPNLKPGIYDIYLAKEPLKDKLVEYVGTIIHINKDHVFQKTGSSFIMHKCDVFEKLPGIGKTLTIQYNESRASTQETALKKTKKLSR